MQRCGVPCCIMCRVVPPTFHTPPPPTHTQTHNIGHDPHNLSERRVWCLETQVQHKVALLKEHVMGPGKPPAVIVAHSIGAYMMLKVGIVCGPVKEA